MEEGAFEEEDEEECSVITALYSDAANHSLFAGDTWGTARVLDEPPQPGTEMHE